ncbi:hypothetical protein FIB18_24520, partial [Brucella pecoris]
MPKRHLQKRAQTVRTLLKSLSANYRNGCPHITEKGVRELVKPAPARVMDGGMVTTAFAAHVAVSKFA